MNVGFQIRAGNVWEIRRGAADWLFVDMGFAIDTNKSCGVLKPDRTTNKYSFGDLKKLVICEAQKTWPEAVKLGTGSTAIGGFRRKR